MRRWRLSDRPIKPDEDDDLKDPAVRAGVKATIFFSYTSNMVSCGVRETIRFLAQHRMVDCIVTSAGGVGASSLPPTSLLACFSTRALVGVRCNVGLSSLSEETDQNSEESVFGTQRRAESIDV